MIIRLPLRFEGSKGEKVLYALFDSGATYSCINDEVIEELENLTPLHTPMKMVTASASTYIEVKYRAALDFYHEDIRLTDEFYVIPNLSEQVIIGASTMQKWRIKLDFEHDTILLDPTVAKAILVNLIAGK
jgi:predicted aspartyl protease